MDKIIIYCDYEAGKEPLYGSTLASGADVKANLIKDVIVSPGESVLIPTGLRLHIPEGYEGQVRPRSGLALTHSITVLNTPGTIDSDYRGELKIILINHGKQDFVIHDNDRIAQIVFTAVVQAEFVKKTDLTASKRGRDGFGSTGT